MNEHEARVSLIRWSAIALIVIVVVGAMVLGAWIEKDKPRMVEETPEQSFVKECVAQGGEPRIVRDSGWNLKEEYTCASVEGKQ